MSGVERSPHGAIELERKLVRYFVCYSQKDKELKDDLLDRLGLLLRSAEGYKFNGWQDVDIELGGNWDQQIQAAIANCDFGLLLVSPGFLASDYIGKHELPKFVAPVSFGPAPGKRAVPVGLKSLPKKYIDLKGLQWIQIFFDSEHRAYSELDAPHTKDKFVNQLFEKIIEMLDRHLAVPALDPPAAPPAPSPTAASTPAPPPAPPQPPPEPPVAEPPPPSPEPEPVIPPQPEPMPLFKASIGAKPPTKSDSKPPVLLPGKGPRRGAPIWRTVAIDGVAVVLLGAAALYILLAQSTPNPRPPQPELVADAPRPASPPRPPAPPRPTDDRWTLAERGTRYPLAVLDNDTAAAGGSLRVVSAGPVAEGTLEVGQDGRELFYTAAPSGATEVSFTYQVRESGGGEAEARVVLVLPGVGTVESVFRDRRADGSECPECPELVVIPAGSFTMGSPASEEGRTDDEGPQRAVTIPAAAGTAAFALGRYEVTFAEWDACVAAGGCNGYRPVDQGWNWDRRPVVNVSWRDAQAYIQ